MLWADTTAGIMKMRNGANSAWISLWELDGTFIATDISLSAGTAGAPSLYFTGDTNTGIYSPGADQVAFSTGGSGKIFIAADGKLGVLTASPTTALSVAGGISGTGALNISGSGWGVLPYVANSLVIDNNAGETRFFATGANATTKGSFIFYNGETDGGTTAAMVIDTSSRVGIGTTTVDYLLDARGPSGSAIQLANTSDSNRGVQLKVTGTSGGTVALNTTSAVYGLTFGIDSAEKARIDTSGRLLVGTSTARTDYFNNTLTAMLQVEGIGSSGAADRACVSIINNNNATVNEAPVLVFGRSNGSTVNSKTLVSNGTRCGYISFQGADGSDLVDAASIVGEIDGTPGANDMPGRLVFSTTADGASSPTERFRIGSAGQLGIGGATYGTSGQVLTSGGASAAPSWQNAAGGAGTLKAWVNFNGTGTVAIRGSGNVSSITDNSTGNYTVNFTTAMANANYARCVTAGANTSTTASNIQSPYNSTPTTTTLGIATFNFDWGAAQDCNEINVAIFQ